jgi:hypothetical protein
MDTISVAYVLCRTEDDSSLTPVSEHENVVDGVAASKNKIEIDRTYVVERECLLARVSIDSK